MKLIVTRQHRGILSCRYRWVILNENGNEYTYGYTWTLIGAKFAAWSALAPRRRKPSRVVFEKEIDE